MALKEKHKRKIKWKNAQPIHTDSTIVFHSSQTLFFNHPISSHCFSIINVHFEENKTKHKLIKGEHVGGSDEEREEREARWRRERQSEGGKEDGSAAESESESAREGGRLRVSD